MRASILSALQVSAGSPVSESGGLPVVVRDMVVYGANPGGLWAAMRGAELGLTQAVINEFDERRVGGMLLGINHTDVETGRGKGMVRGLGDEYYRRVAGMYGAGISQERFMGETGYGTRPDYGRTVLTAMLAERGVTANNDEWLVSVQKTGTRVTSITTNKARYIATTFVDGTYHGDALFKAGADMMLGRESNTQYSEPAAGIRPPSTVFATTISPYLEPGNPASGLLFGISGDSDTYGTQGDASPLIQACSFRLWNHSSNSVCPAPPGYDPARYTLAKRNILARGLTSIGQVITEYGLQGGGGDVNTNGGTGPVGQALNYTGPEVLEYVTATTARKLEIETLIKHWVMGYLYWLRTDTDLPAGIRTGAGNIRIMRSALWGGDGFPPNYYLRQGWLIVGDQVFRQQDVTVTRPTVDVYEDTQVGRVIYAGDRHWSRTVLIDNPEAADGKQIVNEGGMALTTKIGAPIPAWVLFPKKAQLSNMMGVFSISATAIAHGSTRMEVNSMHFGEAAAALAYLQKQNPGVDLQDMLSDAGRRQQFRELYDYWKVYDTNGGAVVHAPNSTTPYNKPVGVAAGRTETEGTWTTPGGSGSAAVPFGAAVGQPGAKMRFYPEPASATEYEVRLCWSAAWDTARNNATIFRVVHAGGTYSTTKNQNVGASNYGDTGDWGLIGGDQQPLTSSRFVMGPDDYVECEIPLSGGTGVIGAVKFKLIS